MSNKIAGVVTKLVSALEGLENADERRRAIQAALTVCGDAEVRPAQPLADASQNAAGAGASATGVNSAAQLWMQRNGLMMQDIQDVIHIDETGTSVISAVGKGKRLQTINTYLLTGVCALFSQGKPEFSDEMARSNCVSLGCYDAANHGKTLKGFDNKFTGSKRAGWKLTAPGLTAAATLLKPDAAKGTK